VNKVIVCAIAGLLLGLGGGAGFAVMRAKKPTPLAAAGAESKKDSAAVATEGHDEPAAAAQADEPVENVVPPAPVAPASGPAVAPAVAPAAARTEQPAGPTRDSAAAARPPSADSTRAAPTATPGRIAKIFAAMPARDAARVLEQLDDADVQTVLTGLNDRQAAAILAGFPPARAAAISRAVIRGRKGTS